jgi:uncharacterized protein
MWNRALVFFFLLVTLSLQAQVPARPDPPRLVNDLAGLLSTDQAAAMESMLVAFSDSTSNQIAVVILSDLMGYDKAELAFRIGQEWGVGQKDFNNGIVVLLKPKQGSTRGEVFIATGYGLEGAIPDAIANRIIDQEMIPRFRENDYYGGLMDGLGVLMKLASGEISKEGYGGGTEPGKIAPLILIILIILIIIFISSNGKRKMHSIGGTIPWWMYLPQTGGSRSSWGGGGGFGGGGGGFGGFGGGGFGGGGAGGSW